MKPFKKDQISFNKLKFEDSIRNHFENSQKSIHIQHLQVEIGMLEDGRFFPLNPVIILQNTVDIVVEKHTHTVGFKKRPRIPQETDLNLQMIEETALDLQMIEETALDLQMVEETDLNLQMVVEFPPRPRGGPENSILDRLLQYPIGIVSGQPILEFLKDKEAHLKEVSQKMQHILLQCQQDIQNLHTQQLQIISDVFDHMEGVIQPPEVRERTVPKYVSTEEKVNETPIAISLSFYKKTHGTKIPVSGELNIQDPFEAEIKNSSNHGVDMQVYELLEVGKLELIRDCDLEAQSAMVIAYDNGVETQTLCTLPTSNKFIWGLFLFAYHKNHEFAYLKWLPITR